MATTDGCHHMYYDYHTVVDFSCQHSESCTMYVKNLSLIINLILSKSLQFTDFVNCSAVCCKITCWYWLLLLIALLY